MQIIQKRKIFYIISLLIIVPGIISLFMQGLNLGIDFEGGSVLQYRLEESANAADVRTILADLELEKGIDVQQSGDEFFIRTPELTQEKTADITEALTAKYADAELLGAELVGATIGSEITRNAFLSVLIAAILILIYITIRFEFTFGIAAIIALLHDILIVLGFFSIFQWEVNSTFIAAILTVIGYSINDTIVIFDRVRENLRMKRKEDRATLLNRSIMQTLNRSVNTVLTSMLPLITLLLFGGTSIKVFVITMIIGFLSGAYSSIFVASPVWFELKNKA
ncbi:MAG: protein translocase subunit SecF [Bacillota bacterium]|nr:protein translocase subunit SecF [Bacillota bacterium]